MALIETIITLRLCGWSRRRIAREWGVDRETVARHSAGPPRRQMPPLRPPARSRLRPSQLARHRAPGSGGPADGADSPPAAPASLGAAGRSSEWLAVPPGDRRGLGAGPVGPADLSGPGRPSTASPAATTVSVALSAAWAGGRSCRSAAWNASPATRRRWTSAAGRRSSCPTAGGG